MGDPLEEERMAAARRALAGIRGSSAKPPAEPKKASGDDEPNMLHALVSAMKQGGISAVEPEGYMLLERVRHDGPMKKGASVAQIEALQRALRRARCQCEESGYLDDATAGAVRQFQTAHGVPVTGVFDATTLDALDRYFGLDKKSDTVLEAPRSTQGRQLLPDTGNAFLDELAPGAVQGMHESGVPASVSMAMAVVESNWGERLIAKDAKNVFALKGKGPAGSAYFREDGTPGGSTEYRRYAKTAESVVDHAKLLASSYPAAMSHRGHADNFASALSETYSPNPRYGFTLIRIMKQFDLYRFDRVRPEE
jgi:flagellum-specific peptidoglycan hydrolase FlgJ